MAQLRSLQKLFSALLLLNTFFCTSLARADGEGLLQEQLQLEDKIQSRVLSIVRSVDPMAQVKLQLRLREISAPLPGTGLGETRMVPLDPKGGLATGSIEEVQVNVETRQSPPPDWLEKRIRDSINLPSIKVTFVFSPLSPQAIEAFEKAQLESARRSMGLNPSRDPAGASPDKPQGLPADPKLLQMLGIGLVCFVVLGLVAMALNRANHRALTRLVEEKLVPAVEQSANRQPPPSPLSNADKGGMPDAAEMAALSGPESGTDDFQDLPLAGIMALLADCYWCEEDGYAHFIWSRLPVERRLEVMEKSALDATYFRHIRGSAAKNLGFHLDPYYLKPVAMNHLSQEDIGNWLKKNSDAVAALSPLRLRSLPLNLEDRLKFLASGNDKGLDARSAKLKLPERPSELRQLSAQLQVSQITEADELFAFKNPKRVPDSVKGSIPTLAWLALRPLEDRKAILERLDARDLAQAWAGPKEVLDLLTEALPAAKAKMLQSYLESVKPDRGSDSFRYLVAASLEKKGAADDGEAARAAA